MNPDVLPAEIARARDLLDHATAIAVLTGAGISAESGIPTFRDALTGLWEKFRPEELATPEAFEANPKLVWDWYAWRREIVARAQPNAGHRALAQMERHVPDFTLITQNVDGLHRAAGSTHVLELHGNIRRSKCFDRGHEIARWPASGSVPPRCPECGSLLRPDVVWFGESLPAAALAAAFAATERCELFLSVGTSTVVAPASSLPFAALERGATVVEINPTATPLTRAAHFALAGSAAEVLPALVAAAWGR
jgi:NAD-dependent deacetylase